MLIIVEAISITSCASQGVTSANWGETKEGESTETVAGEEEKSKQRLVEITMEGGTGKAYIKSPVEVAENEGKLRAKLVWNSKNYDYMIVNGIRYENENTGGESTFTIEVPNLDEPLTVIGDTTAMSTPHEIEYVITWGEEMASEDGAEGSKTAEEQQEELQTETAKQLGEDQIGQVRKEVLETLADAGYSLTDSMDLQYAKGFTVESCEGLTILTIPNSGVYLVVEEGKQAPSNLPKDVTILQKPLDQTYLVSTSAMDLIHTCGALDRIKLSGTAEKDWYIEEAKEAMEKRQLLYAGKYRAPDYELLLQNGCDLAIENTMIYHEPAVKEKLKELGIPVLVETSSYEKHPLGRLEWIKLYGILFDRKEEAEQYFQKQLDLIAPLLSEKKDTGKRVAFFYVTANGQINVRKQGDYITKMIELSGGKYALTNAGESENALSTMNMQMEDFYAQAHDADIIIYNSTIGGEISSVEELLSKNQLFADFTAVETSQVYCCKRNLFQQITGMAEFMQDLQQVFAGENGPYTYLNKLE